MDLSNKFRKHKIRVKEIIRDAEDETASSTRRRPTAASSASSTR